MSRRARTGRRSNAAREKHIGKTEAGTAASRCDDVPRSRVRLPVPDFAAVERSRLGDGSNRAAFSRTVAVTVSISKVTAMAPFGLALNRAGATPPEWIVGTRSRRGGPAKRVGVSSRRGTTFDRGLRRIVSTGSDPMGGPAGTAVAIDAPFSRRHFGDGGRTRIRRQRKRAAACAHGRPSSKTG